MLTMDQWVTIRTLLPAAGRLQNPRLGTRKIAQALHPRTQHQDRSRTLDLPPGGSARKRQPLDIPPCVMYIRDAVASFPNRPKSSFA